MSEQIKRAWMSRIADPKPGGDYIEKHTERVWFITVELANGQKFDIRVRTTEGIMVTYQAAGNFVVRVILRGNE